MIGFALHPDEKKESYFVLFEKFLSLHKNKQPGVIFTDNDKSIKSAVRKIFTETIWIQCNWHLFRNIHARLGKYKNNPQLKQAYDCLTDWMHTYSCDKFETLYGEHLCKKFPGEDDTYLSKIYEDKMSWSRAYLKDHLTANTLTSSRCEVLHSKIKRRLRRYMEIYYLIDILIEVDEGVYEYVPETKQTSNVILSIWLLHPNLFQIKSARTNSSRIWIVNLQSMPSERSHMSGCNSTSTNLEQS